MCQRDDRSERKLNLKSESHIQHHQAKSGEHCDTPVVSELIPDLRSHKFDPTQLNLHIGRSSEPVYHHRALLIRVTIRQAH